MEGNTKLIISEEEILKKEFKVNTLIMQIILLGNSFVGKTSVIKSLVSKSFNFKYIPTNSCEFYLKVHKLYVTVF